MACGPNIDILQQLLELKEELETQRNNSLPVDEDVLAFVSQVCQTIDYGNYLTPQELEEYEAIVESGELSDVMLGAECPLDGTEEDNSSIIEEIRIADEHISLLTKQQEDVEKEMERVCSGMHQLEQKKKAAQYNLLEVGHRCEKLYTEVFSYQEQVINQLQRILKPSDCQDKKPLQQSITDMPLEQYKKVFSLFDDQVKILMKRHFEKDESTMEKFEDAMLQDLEQSYLESQRDCIYRRALLEGKEEADKKLKEILYDVQSSKFSLSMDEIENQSVLLKVKANSDKSSVSLMMENDIFPIVQEDCLKNVNEIKKYKNKYKLMKLHGTHKQLSGLAACMDAALRNVDLLLTLTVTERQKLVDIKELCQLYHDEITEEYSQCKLRMSMMQELKTSGDPSMMKHPLVACVSDLLCGSSPHFPDTLFNLKKLGRNIADEEMKLLDVLLNRQKTILENESTIASAEKFLCAELKKKTLPQKLESSPNCNNGAWLLDSTEELLKRIKSSYEEKRMFFMSKPQHAEQRLLWVHLLLDPHKLTEAVDELRKRRIKRNKPKCLKMEPQTTFF